MMQNREKSTGERVKAVAEFMGCKVMYRDGQHPIVYPHKDQDMHYDLMVWAKYNHDWNWFMEAAQKFDRLRMKNKKYVAYCDRIDNTVTLYDLQAAFIALSDAIEWYNGLDK